MIDLNDLELWTALQQITGVKYRHFLNRYNQDKLNKNDKQMIENFKNDDKSILYVIREIFKNEDLRDALNVYLTKLKIHRQQKARILSDLNNFARSKYCDGFLLDKDKYEPYQMVYFGCDKHVINFTYNLNAIDFQIFLAKKEDIVEINDIAFSALHSGFGWDGWIKSLKNYDMTIKIGTKGDAKKIKDYVLAKQNAWDNDNQIRDFLTEEISIVEEKNIHIYCQVQFMSVAIFENRLSMIWDVFDFDQVSNHYWTQIDYCYDFTVNNVQKFLDSIYINDSRFEDYKKKKNEKWTHDYTYKSKDFYIKVYDSYKDKKSKPITGAHYMRLYKKYIPYCMTIYRIEFSIMREAMNKIRDAYIESGETFESDQYFIRDASRNGKNQCIRFFYKNKKITPFIHYVKAFIKSELTDSKDYQIKEKRVNDALRENIDKFLIDKDFDCIRFEKTNVDDTRLLKMATALVRNQATRQYVMKEGLGSKLNENQILNLIDYASDEIKKQISEEKFLKDFKDGILNQEIELIIKKVIETVFEKSEAKQINQKQMNENLRLSMQDALLTLASDQMLDELKKVSRKELS